MRSWIAALALTVIGLLSLSAVPAPAQTVCQEVVSVTTRTSSPLALTPLDAIAFPVAPVPASSTVVRRITICPAAVPPPTVVSPFTFPVIAPIAPVVSPFVFPVIGPVVIGTSGGAVDPPSGAPSAPAPSSIAPRPAAPVIVGTVPRDTVRDLAEGSEQYDRMVVSVTGTVGVVQLGADGHGSQLTTFTLEAQGTSIGVLVWGRPVVRAGERVRVTGPFYVSTPFVGSAGDPWHDVVEAQVLAR